MSQAEEQGIEIISAARTAVYRLLHAVFGGDPNQNTLETLCNGSLMQVVSVFCDEGNTLHRAVCKLEKSAKSAIAAGPEALDVLSSLYCRLFVGPGKVEADPWESVYNEGEAMLFQQSTLDVRKAYVAQGLIPQSYPHVADDHIALELDFMGMLSERMDKALANHDDNLISLCAASTDFLEKHMLQWVPKFCTRVECAKEAGIYRDAAGVLREFIAIDYDVLNEISGVLKK